MGEKKRQCEACSTCKAFREIYPHGVAFSVAYECQKLSTTDGDGTRQSFRPPSFDFGCALHEARE